MKPNLIIIGAMKAGTTSLHDYLQCHPEIQMSQPKELNYFSSAARLHKGPQWYEKHFKRPATIRGESSTSYTAYPMRPDVPQRIHEFVPDVKLIYLVRDPIDRFVSQYVHHVSEGKEQRPVTEVLNRIGEAEECAYVYQSRYYFQLEQYLNVFDPEQILIISSERLREQRESELAEVCAFLGLDYEFSDAELSKESNRSDFSALHRNWWVNTIYPAKLQTTPRIPWFVKAPFFHLARIGSRSIEKPRLSRDDIEQLQKVFRKDVEQLRGFCGKRFAEWRPY